MKPRLLFVGYELPPRRGPHALRLGYFCKYLSEMGWEIDAIGCEASHGLADAGLSELIPEDVQVKYLPLPKGRLSSLRWGRAAIQAGHQVIRKNRPDVIFSSAPQFVSHMVAHRLAGLSGIPWVADYGDPYTNNPGYSRSIPGQWLARKMEQHWVRRASRICLTTTTAIEDYHRTFPETRGKTEFIPLGYEPEEFVNLNSEPNSDQTFRVAFAGSLHLNTTNGPSEFFKGVVQACRQRPDLEKQLKIDFIQAEGAQEIMAEIVPAELQGVFTFSPTVPYDEMLTKLSSSTCLLMWSNIKALQVPSKIYIYFGLKKPIFAICYGPKDPVRSLVAEHRRGVNVSDESEMIATKLIELIDLYFKGELAKKFSLGEVDRYTWRAISANLNIALRQVAGFEQLSSDFYAAPAKESVKGGLR